MINIVLFLNPNYKNQKIINTTQKELDLVSQFIILYHSIKKNWHFNYRISLFHNPQFPFSQKDKIRLEKLDIDIYKVQPDHPSIPYYCRCSCFTHPLKIKGTHRLSLDCDMLALSEPTFDLNAHFQVNFAGNCSFPDNALSIINSYYNINLAKYSRTKMFISYLQNPSQYKRLFPHFNGGAILIREELCNSFINLWKPTLNLSLEKSWKIPVPKKVLQLAIQYSMSFALLRLSTKWKPFHPTFNYLIKEFDPIKYNGKIQLLHYAGKGADKLFQKKFSNILNSTPDLF